MTRDERRVRTTLDAIDRARAFSLKGVTEAYADAGGVCFYCGKTKPSITRDHVLPKALGGQTVMANIVPACRQCNHLKRDVHPKDWFRRHPKFAWHFVHYATHAAADLLEIARRYAPRYEDKALWDGAPL